VARGARRRGRTGQYVGTGDFLWRIGVVVQGLHRLLDVEQAGERRSQTVHDLTVLEHRIERMLNEAQRAALPKEEEETACDGYRASSSPS
jgi:hypothetical protein